MSIENWDDSDGGFALQTAQVKESCPYCGEVIELVIDPSQGSHDYIEDCFVCCRPITVLVSHGGGEVLVSLRQEDEV